VLQRAELVERRTQEAREEARRLVADELGTVLAHDLRNLLNPLLGRADLLRDRAEREGREHDGRDATLLLEGVRGLNRLITDLLDVGRLEHGLFTRQRTGPGADIRRNGTQPSNKGPAEWFTGTVRIDPCSRRPSPHACAAPA
jgi:signal transduction histidine kinase